MPHGIPSRRGDPVFFQLRRDRTKRQAVVVPSEDRADDLRSCRVGDQISVFALHVAVADAVGKAGTAVVKPNPKTPTDRRALVFALILEKARVNGQESDGVGVVDVQPLHFKEHVHAEAVSIDFTSLKKQISRQELSQMAIRRVLVLIQARARTRARDKHTQTCRKPKAKRKTRNEDGAVFAASTLCEPPRFSVHRFLRFSPFFALSVFPISCFCACA